MVKTKSNSIGGTKKDTITEGHITFEFDSSESKFAEKFEAWVKKRKGTPADAKNIATEYDFFLDHLDRDLMRAKSKNQKHFKTGMTSTRVVLRKVSAILRKRKMPTEEMIADIKSYGEKLRDYKGKGGEGKDEIALDPALIMFTDRKKVANKDGKGFKTKDGNKIYGHYRSDNYADSHQGVTAVSYINNPDAHPLHQALYGKDGLVEILLEVEKTIKDRRVRIIIEGRPPHIRSLEKVAEEFYSIGSVKSFLKDLVNNQVYFRKKTGQMMMSKVRTAIQLQDFEIKKKSEVATVQRLISSDKKDGVVGDIFAVRYNSMGMVALMHLVGLAIRDFAPKKTIEVDGKTKTVFVSPDEYFIWTKGAKNAFDYRLNRRQMELRNTKKKPEDRKYQNNTRGANMKTISKRDWKQILKGV